MQSRLFAAQGHNIRFHIFLALYLIALKAFAWGFPYDLDSSEDGWGNSGTVTHVISGNNDTARTSLITRDGKLVVAGRSDNGTHNEFTISRRFRDGSLDTSFDSDGTATYNFSTGEAIIHGIAEDADGRIVAVGRAWGFADYDFGYARIHTNGAIDTNFTSIDGGKIDFGGNEFARAVDIDSQGRIVITGYAGQPGTYDFAVARLLSDGTLDNAFDSDGMATTSISTANDVAYSLLLQSDDKIIAGGKADLSGANQLAIARFQTNGSLDATFSGDGVDNWNLNSVNDVIWGMSFGVGEQILATGRSATASNSRMFLASYGTDGAHNNSAVYSILTSAISRAIYREPGTIYLGGTTNNGSNWDFALLKISEGESLDSSFNSDGFTDASPGSNDDFSYGLKVQQNGRIVLVGRSENASNSDFGVARFYSNGDLDTTFSSDGLLTTAISSNDDVAHAVSFQTDGKIIVAGSAVMGTVENVAIARYLSNGTLDASFSGDGLVTFSIGSAASVANAVAVGTDGRIMVAGLAYNGTSQDFMALRVLSNGSLDGTFGTGGIVQTNVNSANGFATSLAAHANGQITVGGWVENGGNNDFAIVRYYSSGNLDTTFSSDGIQITDIGTNSNDVAYGIALYTDGRVAAVGSTADSGQRAFAVTRYLNNGSLDAAFDTDGIVTTNVNSDGAEANDILITSDQKLFVSGQTADLRTDFVMAKYEASGALDTTFGTNGLIVAAVGTGSAVSTAVAMSPTGTLYAGGYADFSNYDFVLAAFTGFGGLDATFNGNGIATTAIGAGNEGGYSITREGTRIDLIGRTISGADFEFALARYDDSGGTAGSGAIDSSFASNGSTTANLNSFDDVALAVVTDANNRVYIGGYTNTGSARQFAISRYLQNGTIDNTFGTNGTVTTAVGSANSAISALTLQSNGRVVAVGVSNNGTDDDLAVARYYDDGNLDTTFSSDGIATSDVIASEDNGANGVAIDAGGKIVVSGYSQNSGHTEFAVVRFTSTGGLDGGFGTGGITTPRFDAGSSDTGYGIAIQDNGRIIVSGETENSSRLAIGVVRLYSNGDLDTTFDSDGFVVTEVDTHGSAGFDVDIQSTGRIVVAGRTYDVSVSAALVRYLTDGNLDTSFSSDGIVLQQVGSNVTHAHSVASTDNNKIIIGGYCKGTAVDFCALRYHPDGTLDTSFSGDGIATFDIGGADDVIYGMTLDSIGRIVGAGGSYNGTNFDFAAIRVWP